MPEFNKKNRNAKRVTIYSIGEKIAYYRGRINRSDLSYSKQLWARVRLNELNAYKKRNNIGNVFLINDKTLGSNKSKFPRRVVLLNQDSKNNVELLKLLPYKKSNYRFDVKNFDGLHNLDLVPISHLENIRSNRKLTIYDLYEKHHVYGTDNDYLTDTEKIALDIFTK